MNEKNDYISVAEMLEYMQGHDKAQHMYNDMTILRQTVLDPCRAARSISDATTAFSNLWETNSLRLRASRSGCFTYR